MVLGMHFINQGNKSDLKGDSVDQNVSNIAQAKMKELGLTYMEVSAKTGHNIKEFFKELSYVIAGGNKKKDETISTKTA